jgi:probable phosphoglycerate mutase
MLRIILVRHGETEWNKIHRLQGGSSDVPLNETGRRQAESLALKLNAEKIQGVYSSTLERALRTAREIARHHQLEVHPVPELKEINVGALEGIFSATLPQRFDEFICRDRHIYEAENPSAESIGTVQKRAWEAISNIVAKHPNGSVVAVSHYFVIATLVCRVLELPLDHIGHLKSNPGTITTFLLDGSEAPRLELFNGAV